MGFTVCLQPKTPFARCPGLGIQWSKSIFNKFHDIDPAKPQTLNRIAFKEPWNLLLRESFRQFAIFCPSIWSKYATQPEVWSEFRHPFSTTRRLTKKPIPRSLWWVPFTQEHTTPSCSVSLWMLYPKVPKNISGTAKPLYPRIANLKDNSFHVGSGSYRVVVYRWFDLGLQEFGAQDLVWMKV